ncbi:MAG: P1 family peptidase [Actinomycetales bacterium]|nr:P1 family peptidase [Actinomycetales bacterium]
MRARDLGIDLAGQPGPLNALTDVPGVQVGMVTLIEDFPGADNACRTGVTAILPLGRDGIGTSVPAGIYALNGNGEMTGSHWITETGALPGPVMITNTHAVGTIHRGVIDWTSTHRPDLAVEWLLPVVAETWDGYLNSINEDYLQPHHAGQAIDAAVSGPVPEGSCGGGTGMNCYGFKGGSGTASRVVTFADRSYTVGAFVQANFGARHELSILGVPMHDLDVPDPLAGDWFEKDRRHSGGQGPPGAGSVIAIIATDAPLLPQQCQALVRRVPLGLARTGTSGSHFSGDLFLGFSTGNAGALDSGFPTGPEQLRQLACVPWNGLDRFFTAVVQSIEEAVLNALVNNANMQGRSGHFSPALPVDQVQRRLRDRSRLLHGA